MSLQAKSLGYSISGHPLLNDVSLDVAPARLHAVIGPNGAGKSTLLKLLAGELKPVSGQVLLEGKSLDEWTPRQRALMRAVLPQSETLRFGFTSEEVVRLGRLSSGELKPEREAEIIHEALKMAGVEHLCGRKYPSLSGGERARVQFARVLAQIWMPTTLGERYLLLDEPTANLDFAHQHACLAAARRMCTQNIGVLAVLHDPNLALAYAHTVTLLAGGKLIASGSPFKVLTPDNLYQVYGVKVELLKAAGGERNYLALHP